MPPPPTHVGNDAAPGSSDGGEPLTMTRAELASLVHDLRNHLNSVLMNAGLVAARCPDRERVARNIELFEQSGDRCAALLRQVSDRYL